MVQRELDPTSNPENNPENKSEFITPEERRQKELKEAVQDYRGPVWAKIYSYLNGEEFTTPLGFVRLRLEVYEQLIGYALRQSSVVWYETPQEAILTALVDGSYAPYQGQQDYSVGVEYRCEQCSQSGGTCGRCIMLNEDADMGW